MKLGIKVSLGKQSFLDLIATDPSLAEVWFNVNRAHEYGDLFVALKKKGIDVGLHYWGVLDDGTWTNISYPDTQLIKQSIQLMKKTILIAAQHGFSYVNIHPGTRAKVALDFKYETFTLLSEPINLADSTALFITHMKVLHDYARQRGIVFTVESVPKHVTDGWYDQAARLNPKNVYELPIEVIEQAAGMGFYVANDFGHTAANIISDNSIDVWNFLKSKTVQLAPQTRLIHLGFLIPPYNGTDYHDMLDNPLLKTSDAIPNNQQFVELLKLFKSRDDVWIITEPKNDHVKNYFLAKKILDKI